GGGKLYEPIPVHQRVLPVVEGVLDPGYLVSSLSSISIDPGERAPAARRSHLHRRPDVEATGSETGGYRAGARPTQHTVVPCVRGRRCAENRIGAALGHAAPEMSLCALIRLGRGRDRPCMFPRGARYRRASGIRRLSARRRGPPASARAPQDLKPRDFFL